MNALPLPPGPRKRFPGDFFLRFRTGPIALFEKLAREHGDVVFLNLGFEKMCLVNDPALIRDILVTHHQNFHKGRGLEMARKLLGQGILTSEGDFHRRQRRLMQPAFHHERIRAYGEVMVRHAVALREGWQDGATLDLSKEMARLTLGIVAETLFGSAIEDEAREVGEALTAALDSFYLQMLPLAGFLEKLPIATFRRGLEARKKLDAIIYRLIRERRESGEDRGDLLSMLLAAQDEEDGDGMTDTQVRDEAMTIFLAGHETTANALTWTWYLLSQNPAIAARVRLEIDTVTGGGLPAMEHTRVLPFTEQVITESMRLYPPAWIIARRAQEPYQLGGYEIPARCLVLMSQFVMHRDARHFPDPLRFDPDRWTPEFRAGLPKYAYFPFGGGPRQCIGEGFAWMELLLLIATLAQRWSFGLVEGHPIVPHPQVTLRAKHGMKMILRRRSV